MDKLRINLMCYNKMQFMQLQQQQQKSSPPRLQPNDRDKNDSNPERNTVVIYNPNRVTQRHYNKASEK